MGQAYRDIDMVKTPVFDAALRMTGRVRCFEGGMRSSKTWSILQWVVMYCARNEGAGKVVTVSRYYLKQLKDTTIKDFLKILRDLDVYEDEAWNRSAFVYKLFGNSVEFLPLENVSSLHGRSQDVLYINEAVQCPEESFRQLNTRTREIVILDWNPSVVNHWIYDRILTRPDVDYHHSTQLMNPFLPKEQRAEILLSEPTEENILRGTADARFWEIYGLGKRCAAEGQVYTNVAYCRDFPDGLPTFYGLDFGYTNDPTACVRVCVSGGELYVDELLYETRLTNRDIADIFDVDQIVDKGRPLYCDSAEPKSIEDLHRYGWNALPVKKGPDSVRNGIDILKSYRMNVTERSLNLKRELENYTWRRDKDGQLTGEPVDRWNHLLDATRYVALMELNRKVGQVQGIGRLPSSAASYGQRGSLRPARPRNGY